jgi:hypothetical protein
MAEFSVAYLVSQAKTLSNIILPAFVINMVDSQFFNFTENFSDLRISFDLIESWLHSEKSQRKN